MQRRKRKGRPVHGILLLDKPLGASSNAALQQVKRLFDAAKAGHTGSLDPLATGLLPVCFGEATKLSTYLLDADKRYWVEGVWGERTASGDAEAEVVETDDTPLTAERIEAVLPQFTGAVSQVPPMHSAVKHQGKRLYELARKGVEVEREAREIQVRELKLLAADADTRRFVLDVRCSKGTYVRTLVEDIAAAAGSMAYVSQLRRTGIGPYEESQMVGVEAIGVAVEQGHEALDAMLLPLESVFTDWPRAVVDESRAFYLSRGQAVRVVGAPADGRVAIVNAAGSVLGIGEIDDDGLVAPRRWMQR